MGDISDYYRRHDDDEGQAFHHHRYKEPLDNLIRVPVKHSKPFTRWVQGDGTKILVANMTNTHIMNCINRIDRLNWRPQWKEPLMQELEARENELNEPIDN